jgi:TATA-box binding protein (TBP) (component of TFIID and TFIIIB)
MLIPLLPEHQRMGRKSFRRVIDGLMRTGNAFFIQKTGKVILMAEAIKENAAELRRFKRAERQRTGSKSIKRGTEIPIAVLVPNVTLKRRFDLEGAVRGQLSVLARAIEKQLNKI